MNNSSNNSENLMRSILKNDQLKFNESKNLQAILTELEKSPVKKHSIIPLTSKPKLTYWIAAAAMIAIVCSFGIENWASKNSSSKGEFFAQDSILDSSSVRIDTIVPNWD